MDNIDDKTQHTTNANRINHIYILTFFLPWFCPWYHMGASHWWVATITVPWWNLVRHCIFLWTDFVCVANGVDTRHFCCFCFLGVICVLRMSPLFLKVAISIGHWLVLSSEPLLEKWKMGGWKPWENMAKSASLFYFFLRYSTQPLFSFFPIQKSSPVVLRIFWVEYIPLLLQMLVLRRELRRFEALPKSDPNDRRSYH